MYICNQLQPLIRPRYIAAMEERVYLEGMEQERIPDVWIKRRKRKNGAIARKNGAIAVLEADEPVIVKVTEQEIHEAYVTILDLDSAQRLVTVIELVSPTNKYTGPGREAYLAKQNEIRHSDAHLVEIDLLRTGPHVLAVYEKAARERGAYDYLACVNRAKGERHVFELYPRTLQQSLPKVKVPLAGKDRDVVLDVQAVLRQTYEDGRYRERIDYSKPCQPPLTPEQQAWANQLIKKATAQTSRNGKRKTRV